MFFDLSRLWFIIMTIIYTYILYVNYHIAKGVDKSYFARDPIYSRAMSLHIPCIIFMYVCV